MLSDHNSAPLGPRIVLVTVSREIWSRITLRHGVEFVAWVSSTRPSAMHVGPSRRGLGGGVLCACHLVGTSIWSAVGVCGVSGVAFANAAAAVTAVVALIAVVPIRWRWRQ